MDEKEIEEQMKNLLAMGEVEKETDERPQIPPQDFAQIADKLMTPTQTFEIITKDIKTANLDKKTMRQVITLGSIAKSFIAFRDAFGLQKENDLWTSLVIFEISGDMAMIANASQGLSAKLLDLFVSQKREAKIKFEKDKSGLVWR